MYSGSDERNHIALLTSSVTCRSVCLLYFNLSESTEKEELQYRRLNWQMFLFKLIHQKQFWLQWLAGGHFDTLWTGTEDQSTNSESII